MSGLFTGAAMAAGLTLQQAIIATILGNAILALYGGFVGAAGAREGVGTAMLSRHAFGRRGSVIVGGVLAFTHVGWYSVQVGFLVKQSMPCSPMEDSSRLFRLQPYGVAY